MTQKISKLFLLSFLLSGWLHAQIKEYNYKREIKGITEQWHSIILPDAIYEKTKNNLDDIRIYGITKKDTIEAPYALTLKNSETKINPVAFKLLNESHTHNEYFYTFEVPNKVIINEIFLNFEVPNFDYRIKIEGSQNQFEWYTIKDNYRILSIENSITNYKFTTLKFPDSSYLYFRITVNTSEDPHLNGAKIYENNTVPAIYKNYTPKNIAISHNKNTKETVLEIELDKTIPISYIKINVDGSTDYLRPTTISYIIDSVNTEKGWKYNYRNLTSSVLSSINNNEFTFFSTKVKKIKVTIHNHDNEPLEIDDVFVKGFEYELKARFDKPATYFLVYGNTLALEPIYDINLIANAIPENAKKVRLGEELDSLKEVELGTKPLFENKNWLWAIMVLIISIIGWFTFKMIKKTN